jgi:ATP-binding protein involved in chromosome partitioning
MSATEQQALELLRTLRFPGFERDVVSLGVVRGVTVDGDVLRVAFDPRTSDPAVTAPLEQAVREALLSLPGVRDVQLSATSSSKGSPALRLVGAPAAPPSVARAGALDSALIPEVRNTVAVASGKGGVGKSTVAVNLAVALAREGLRVGLLDADIYGPSIPLMTGIEGQPKMTPERKLVPFERFGIRVMSLGFLVDPNSAVIWRGPMVMKALEQLLRDVAWGALDVLVVDMPPGTGDAQLTLSQRVRLAGAVIVTTPQDVALADARKGVAMFQKVDVPILGIVENMSYFHCPECSHRAEIFGHGGGAREAKRLGVPFLGEIPLDAEIRGGGDAGQPILERSPDSPAADAIRAIARSVRDAIGGGNIFSRFRDVSRGPAD